MGVIKNDLKKNFLVIPNKVIESDLSHGAFRVFCYICSKPDGWTVRNKDIQNRLGIKQSQTLANYFKELMSLGWIAREQRKGKDGKIIGGFDYRIMENQQYGKSLIGENPESGENHIHSNTDSISNTDIISKKEKIVYSKEVQDCFSECLNYFSDDLHPDTPTKINNCLDTIDKLNRLDGVKFEHIINVVKGIRQDDFWSKNFLSIAKLRKTNSEGIKYIVVFSQALRNKKGSNDGEPRMVY